MRFFSTLFTTLPCVALCTLALSVDANSKTPRPKVCDPYAKGPRLAELQEEAIQEFAHLWLVKKDIQTAWDRWIPGKYIQHHPNAVGDREWAIEFLKQNFAAPGTSTSNITVFSGKGFGVLHYKWTSPNITYAISDRFRFEGTCMVEHWDVIQTITGNEPNPLAFF
ncbi:hypothetical protein CC1G_02862 [Coprinopsis cinerea okayama7|uniref:SnoaL-like domain-containing protein n=1 Tax=Coprinopsis cinerea (strain Okayama-7 / 130 / ATCC MYA-4618 / FGSC 9003) TaxID=240176 RepID=A8N093_COPC7|nr:hypothetical protein CC1G_02862 [Coprinopsis cinerea okayama7\|eukprot:XP_001828281.1 hypothetical protein CC1G_02862 [Coprinopsis cinerea okayama7\